MSGEFDNQVIYSREKRANGKPRIRIAASVSAKKEVQDLLASLEKASGGCTLEVQTIERIHKEEWQKSFEMKKAKLRQRSEQSAHWKYHELNSLKKDIRDKVLTSNNLSEDEKVLEHRVYVGVDKDKTVEGIAETGFATTKCTNNWFGFGHYVTSYPWYAARYGMDGCYGGEGGILDPHADVAEGKLGRLLVCRAVMSNVYPITRSCTEDHEIENFDMAVQQGRLWSEWYNESSDKPKALKQGYDAHFVRVKKADAGDYSNFLACPDGDVLKTADEIADELVLREEEQLLPEYYVHFCVRKLADGLVCESGSSSGSDKESLKIFSSPAGSSTSCPSSRPSTQKAIDSPRGSVDVLLVDTQPNINNMWAQCERLEKQGFDACCKTITSLAKLNEAVGDRNPSIVCIQGSGNEGLKWRRNLDHLDWIEELAMYLANGPNIEGEWKHWRGCVLNFGTAEQHIADKLCEKLHGKLNLLGWAVRPDPEDMEALLSLFVQCLGEKSTYEKNEQDAFAQACQKTMQYYKPEQLVMAPRPRPPSAVRRKSPPPPMVLPNPNNDADKDLLAISHSCYQKAAASASSSLAIAEVRRIEASYTSEEGGKVLQIASRFNALPSPPHSCASSSFSSFSPSSLSLPPLPSFLSLSEVSIETKLVTDPPVAVEIIQKSPDEDRREFNQYLKQVVGEKCGARGIGSFYVRMSVAAFESLCSRVDVNEEPVYLKLPVAWGVGETRITKVLPGRMCWLEAVMPARDVQTLCNILTDQLESMKFGGMALAEELGEAAELRVRTMAGRAVQATVNKEPCGKQVFEARVETLTEEILVEVSGTEAVRDFKEKVANKMGWASHRETKLVLDGVHLHHDYQSLFECGLTDDNRSFQAIRVEAYTEAIDRLNNPDPFSVGEVFQCLPANAKRDEKVIRTAFNQCSPSEIPNLFKKLPEESQGNAAIIDIVFEKCDGTGIYRLYQAFPHEFRNRESVMNLAFEKCAYNQIHRLFSALPAHLQEKAEIIDKAFENCDEDFIPKLYKVLPGAFKESAEIVDKAFAKCDCYKILELYLALPSAFKKKEYIVKTAWQECANIHGCNLYAAMPEEWKKNADIIERAFEKCDSDDADRLYQALPDEFKHREDLILRAFERCNQFSQEALRNVVKTHTGTYYNWDPQERKLTRGWGWLF